MKKQILKYSTLLAIFAISQAQPIGVGEADVKIEKQRLVKFPDEVDQLQGSTGNSSEKSNAQMDEAERIIQEIEKINHALGYVRKQTEQSKLPPILDSSQYLFPKPLMQPFHLQHHQTTAINGETILLPSISQRYNDLPVFKETLFPYYGGLKGQTLQLIRMNDGADNMFIIAPGKPAAALSDTKPVLTRKSSISITADDIESLKNTSPALSFEQDFNRIQIAAARLVAIQEIAKRKGSFSSEDNRVYAESLLELGQAAQKLANLQKSGKIKDFSLLLKPDIQMPHKQPAFQTEPISGADTSGSTQKVEEVTEQQFNEEDFLPPNTEDPYEDVSDTVAITAPKKDASVAEAKPVGLSIAGEGGVASSKPNAVALSGRNGLAVSAPKATAIAGVSAEEAAAYSVSIPNRNNLVIKTGNRFTQRPVYDDYSEDYSDVPSIRSAFTRDAYASNGSPAPVDIRKNKHESLNVGSPSSGAADSFVDKWKTMVAEDYAGSARSAPFRTKMFVKDLSKTSQPSTDIKT